jgi:FkbM family methyltransferase
MYNEWEASLKESLKSICITADLKSHYKGNWIMDVGSNVGAFISYIRGELPTAKILAFEPVKKYYQWAFQKHGIDPNIVMENLALSDRTERTLIYVAKNNIGWNTMIPEMIDDDNRGDVEEIKAIAFDWYYMFWGQFNAGVQFDIIKIDVEGFEYKVINGMRAILTNQKPLILCEIGWGKKHPQWEKELEAFEFLKSVGYTCDMNIQNLEGTTDVIFRCKP